MLHDHFAQFPAARIDHRGLSVEHDLDVGERLLGEIAVQRSRRRVPRAPPAARIGGFQPQRETNLETRLAEFTPAGSDAAVIFVT